MNSAPIYFQFPDQQAADMAFDTLKELEYQVHRTEGAQGPTVQITVDQNDLTSALEIAQSHGGSLLGTAQDQGNEETFSMAYDLGGIPIPAHVVNEDWSDQYADGKDEYGFAAIEEEEERYFDPSGDQYDHFPGGVRL